MRTTFCRTIAVAILVAMIAVSNCPVFAENKKSNGEDRIERAKATIRNLISKERDIDNVLEEWRAMVRRWRQMAEDAHNLEKQSMVWRRLEEKGRDQIFQLRSLKQELIKNLKRLKRELSGLQDDGIQQ